MSYMNTTVTIRLDAELRRRIDQTSRQSGQSRSAVVREALRRQLALVRFDELRGQILPFAERQGYLADEDVARVVS